MRIAITNDDGVSAEGLQRLWRGLLEGMDDEHDIYVVAPDREQSASGHAITLHKPLRVNRITVMDEETDEERGAKRSAVKVWSVNGTPADCIKLAVKALLPEKPDLVISGINKGSNLGTDVYYSGTVSAAIEGVILGVPSLAVSLTAAHGDRTANFAPAVEFTRELVRRIDQKGLPGDVLLNVNIPNVREGKDVSGQEVTRLGQRQYENVFHKRTDPRGRVYYWMAGEVVDGLQEGTDVKAIEERRISITPLHLHLTDEERIPVMRQWLDS